MVDIWLDHKLRIAQSQLPRAVHDHIVDALSIPNVARQKAMEQNIWGWKSMPETISLWSHVDSHLEMPRGFLKNLIAGLGAYELEHRILDDRHFRELPPKGAAVPLRKWQEPAVQAIIANSDGIYKAPAGSGKTVAVLETIRRLNCRSIVLVSTKDILWQWMDRAAEHLGPEYPVGQIGDGVFEPSEYMTIATIQTLHSKRIELEESGFFDSFSFMCLDECHHATADTFNRLVDRFSSCYRIGVSATPDKTGDFALATNVLGPIFHETKRRDVDSLIEPEVFRIPTSFNFKYLGAKGRRPSNYPQLLQKLIRDPERNSLIVKSMMIEDGTHKLIISKRLEHLETLARMLSEAGYSHPMFMLTGKESSERRQEIVEIAQHEPCALFSTLADEALDIPRLDRLFLVYPQRNDGLIAQQVGRICRAHPDKPDAKVFDFHDYLVGPLDAQWQQRRLKVYQPHHYHISTALPAQIFAYENENDPSRPYSRDQRDYLQNSA